MKYKLTYSVRFIVIVLCSICMVEGDIGGHLARLKKDIPSKQQNVDWWANHNCRKFRGLFNKNNFAIRRLGLVIQNVEKDKDLPDMDKAFQVKTFQLFQKELNESANLVLQSLSWLENTLKGDYKDLMDMMTNAEARLNALKDATLKEQEEYDQLMKAEKFVENRKELEKRRNHTQIQRVIDDLLDDVAKAADQLEEDLDDHVFDNAVHDASNGKKNKIEAVVRLEEHQDGAAAGMQNKSAADAGSEEEPAGIIKLVDSKDNQFVLSKGKDSTVPLEDHHFIEDVLYLTLLSFACGWLCSLFHLPTMFGYIVAGVVLGPSGFNILKSLVQVETLGEFGVFFILFSVGLEFSPDTLKKVFKVASVGTTLMMALMVCAGLLVGYAMGTPPNESAFVAACLSLSSTPLIVKFLAAGGEKDGKHSADKSSTLLPSTHPLRVNKASPGHYDYGPVLMGILIMQDVLLGVLVALLPALASTGQNMGQNSQTLTYAGLAARLGAALCGMVALTFLASRFLIGPLYRWLLLKGTKEIIIMATICLAFIMLLLTDWLHISMELGCFLAGVIISSRGPELSEHIEGLVQPVKDFLACLFFASIGLHVFPTFLAYELTVLVTMTMAIVGTKFFISVLVLTLPLSSSSWHVKWIVSAGLAQVSEFSFVLGSRARRLHLISREVYLLILSVTTLSLLFAPVLWKMVLWYLRVRHPRSEKHVAGETESQNRRRSSSISKSEEEEDGLSADHVTCAAASPSHAKQKVGLKSDTSLSDI